MDISRLNISIPNYQTTHEEGTVTYTILVKYGGLSWEVWRRYSQFTQLYQDLEDDGYCALPCLPPKTLIGPPQDPDALEERRQRLQLFLRGLLKRPDTRTSPQLLDFLLFNEQTNLDVEPLRPVCVCSTGVQRFAVSALAYSARRKLLLVGHEEKSGYSRLGRLWSIVEPDLFGLLNVWKVEGDFACLSLLHSFKTQAKVRCMHLDDASGQLFVGHDDGNIEVYTLPTDSSAMEKTAVLPLHHAAVMRLAAGSKEKKRLLSIGFDSAMRVFEVESHRVLCGGRLHQRLLQQQEKSSVLTAALLHDDNERDVAFLGTSAGQLLLYRVHHNPPEFMQSCMLQPSHSVETLHLDQTQLYVAHGDTVSILSVEWKRRDAVASFTTTARVQMSGAAVILSTIFQAQFQHLFLGYDAAIACWSAKEREPLCVFDGHRGGTHQLLVAGDGQLLLSGGDSGNTKVWRLPPAKEMKLWIAEDSSLSPSSSCSPAAAAAEERDSAADVVYAKREEKEEVGSRRREGGGTSSTAEEEDFLLSGGTRSRPAAPSLLLQQLNPAAATAARAAKAAAATAAATAAAAAERCLQASADYLPVAAAAATQFPSSLRSLRGSSSSSYDDRDGILNSSSSKYHDTIHTRDDRSNSSSYAGINSSSSSKTNTCDAEAAAAPAAAAAAFLKPLGATARGEEEEDEEALNDLRSAFR